MRNSRPFSSHRAELFALANLQNLKRTLGKGCARPQFLEDAREDLLGRLKENCALCSTAPRILLSGFVQQRKSRP